MKAILYYAHDPMCSWCWGYRPQLVRLRQSLPPEVRFEKLLGGLAPDSDQPMPDAMQVKLQDTWRRIQGRIPGTEFNFDFWTRCKPRRSTWPACRAVIAARQQDLAYDDFMVKAIQKAYYLQARNPSDRETLMQLAVELGLKTSRFERDLDSEQVAESFAAERKRAKELGLNSFPSLLLEVGGNRWPVPVDYTDARATLEMIYQLCAAAT